jgi:membrane-associated HD superfamily phosphohydrolase
MVFNEDDDHLKEAAFSLAKKLIEPNSTFNKEATEKNKLAIIGETNSTFFQVQKNEMIVREGEKIGYLELAKLNAFYKSVKDKNFPDSQFFLDSFLLLCFFPLSCIFGAQETGLQLQPVPTLIYSFSALLRFCKYYSSRWEFSSLWLSTKPSRFYRQRPVFSPYLLRLEQ